MSYTIIHTVNTTGSERAGAKLSAARALYAELLKYYNTKTADKKSA